MKKLNITKRQIKDFLIINFGVLCMAFAYTLLIDRNDLVAGGVGGIATILSDVIYKLTSGQISILPSIIIFTINVILLIIALIFINKDFFLKTLYCSIIYPVYIFFAELILKLLDNVIPNLTVLKANLILEYQNNPSSGLIVSGLMAGSYLLIVVFAAVSVGYGIGLTLKKNASTGGVDIVQQLLLRKLRIPLSVSLFMIDGSIVVSAAIYYNDFFMILYGFLFIYISGKVIDAIVFSGFNSRAVHIITKNPDLVKEKIYEVLNRGVTEIYSRGGYKLEDRKMLICIMSNKEFYKMRSIIQELDNHAFIYVARVSEVHGEGFSYAHNQVINNDQIL